MDVRFLHEQTGASTKAAEADYGSVDAGAQVTNWRAPYTILQNQNPEKWLRRQLRVVDQAQIQN